MQARGDGDSRSSVLLIYVQMLSLWYAAVRYDQQLREAFKKHRNALRLTATRRWPRLVHSRGVRHDVFISHVWETGQDTSAVIQHGQMAVLVRP